MDNQEHEPSRPLGTPASDGRDATPIFADRGFWELNTHFGEKGERGERKREGVINQQLTLVVFREDKTQSQLSSTSPQIQVSIDSSTRYNTYLVPKYKRLRWGTRGYSCLLILILPVHRPCLCLVVFGAMTGE